MTPKEPVISDNFNIDDIRKIRDYNAERYLNMTVAEIISEVNGKAGEMVKLFGLKPIANV